MTNDEIFFFFFLDKWCRFGCYYFTGMGKAKGKGWGYYPEGPKTSSLEGATSEQPQGGAELHRLVCFSDVLLEAGDLLVILGTSRRGLYDVGGPESAYLKPQRGFPQY